MEKAEKNKRTEKEERAEQGGGGGNGRMHGVIQGGGLLTPCIRNLSPGKTQVNMY